jgi:hypothetical protein
LLVVMMVGLPEAEIQLQPLQEVQQELVHLLQAPVLMLFRDMMGEPEGLETLAVPPQQLLDQATTTLPEVAEVVEVVTIPVPLVVTVE